MKCLHLCLALFQVTGSSLLLFGSENNCSPDVVGVSPYEGRFYIRDGKLVVEGCSSNLEVHHYGLGALHSRADGVREGSLVVANPKSSKYRFDQSLMASRAIEYWRYLFHAGEVSFGDMARAVKSLDGGVDVYLVAKPGTNAGEYRFEKRPLEYPRLSGLEDLVSDYGLIDVALEDPSLEWVDFILHAHPDLFDAWTSTTDRVFKLLGTIVWGVIAEKTPKDQGLEALKGLSGCSSAAGRVLSAHESGASVQEAIRTIVRSAHPLFSIARVLKTTKNAPYLRALGIEVLYCVEKTLPGRVEMAHDIVGLQGRVEKRCSEINWTDTKFPDLDVLKRIVDRLQKSPEYRDDVLTMFVCLKYSALVPDMKEALLKESMEVCQKHQLGEAIPMLFMLSLGKWDWEKSEGFYQRLKSCQSVEAMFEAIRSFIVGSQKYACKRQSYWDLCCRGVPSSAPHLADLVLHSLSCGRVFERSCCQCGACAVWKLSKDMLFHCVGEGLSRPMRLSCDLRRILSHFSHRPWHAVLVSSKTCIDSLRPSWHSQYTLDDAVAEFVIRNGPPLMQRALATYANRMKLGNRTMPELPNRAVLAELVREVPEGSRLGSDYRDLYFSPDGVGAAEVASRWTVENSDYAVLSRSSVDGSICVLDDGLVAMSSYAFQDPDAADSLIRYTGPRTVGQLSRTINFRHSHVSVQVDEKGGRIRVCRVVGGEIDNGCWTRSVVLRWSPGRGVSLFQFSRNQDQTVYFSADNTGPELFCVFSHNSHFDPDERLGRYRRVSETIGNAGAVRFDSDVVPTVRENGDLDSLASPSGVEVVVTEANRMNAVVRVLSEHCLDGMLHMLRDVQTWEHMEWMVRELDRNLLAVFRVFSSQ